MEVMDELWFLAAAMFTAMLKGLAVVTVIALGCLMFVRQVPVVTETKGSAGSIRTKEAEKAKEIKQKKRSLDFHKMQLTHQVRMCKFIVGHYKVDRSMEAKETVDQAWQRVLGRQVKSKEILDELHSLDEEEEESYIKQRKE